jgi:hypothetical protein
MELAQKEREKSEKQKGKKFSFSSLPLFHSLLYPCDLQWKRLQSNRSNFLFNFHFQFSLILSLLTRPSSNVKGANLRGLLEAGVEFLHVFSNYCFITAFL